MKKIILLLIMSLGFLISHSQNIRPQQLKVAGTAGKFIVTDGSNHGTVSALDVDSYWKTSETPWTGLNYEVNTNKVTSINGSSTNTQYPSAKLVYDQLVTKQATLVSGINIKTINGTTILGSGDLTIAGAAHDPVTLGTANGLSLSTQAISLAASSGATTGALTSTDWTTFNNKQAALVSSTNIKTVSNYSLLGAGNVALAATDIVNTPTGTLTAINVQTAINQLESTNPVKYNSASYITNTGTNASGTVTDLAAVGGTDVVFNEVTGADPLRVTFTFTSVVRLSSFVFYGRYTGGAGHVLNVEAYNNSTSTWDILGEFGTSATKSWYSFPLYVATNYINSGSVQIRIAHQGTGINTHVLVLDYMEVNYGGGGGSSNVTASSIIYVPAGNVAASNVQSAITELDNEKVATTDTRLAPLSYPSTLSVDDTYYGETMTGTAGENLVVGDLVYFKFSDLKYWKATASAYTTARCRGVSTGTIAANTSGMILFKGIIRHDAWNWTAAEVWLSTTAGTGTSTQPSATGNQIQFIGTALSADLIYFNPSNDIGEK